MQIYTFMMKKIRDSIKKKKNKDDLGNFETSQHTQKVDTPYLSYQNHIYHTTFVLNNTHNLKYA